MMDAIALPKTPAIQPEQAAIGLKVAMGILDKWECDSESQWKVLGLGRSTFFKRRNDTQGMRLSGDQVERISYILNIHAALRTLFDNPENVHGFMRMKNHNAFFNGATPLSLVEGGNFGSLYETHKRIDALRGAGL